MNRRPPAFAAWLLCTFGAGSTTDDLLGDLTEEYAAGRSYLWFWWQVLAAIPISLMNEVRAHPVLTLRAIGIGWLAMFLLNVGGSFVQEVIEVSGYPYLRIEVPAYRMVSGVWMFVGMIPMNTWYYFYGPASFVRIIFAAYLAGWLVARCHSRLRSSAVLAFAVFVIVQTIYAYSVRPTLPPEVLRLWFSAGWVRWTHILAPLVALLLGGLRTRHLSPPVAHE
jgi:hypothetical protein